jgi:transcriptional regulator with XRE-family HTH domain
MTYPAHSEEIRSHAIELRRAGHTQRDVCARLGINRTTIKRWEKVERPLTWETARWASAHAVVKWLEDRRMQDRINACGVEDPVSRWRAGGTTSFWQVDRVFTKLGLHVAQLPDDVWVARRRG